jgi:hypothetical protein
MKGFNFGKNYSLTSKHELELLHTNNKINQMSIPQLKRWLYRKYRKLKNSENSSKFRGCNSYKNESIKLKSELEL